MTFESDGIASTDAKTHFGEILNRCVYGKQPVVIKRHDKPVAILVRYEDWQKQQKAISDEPPKLLQEIRATRESIALYQKSKKIGRGKSAVELVRELRDESLK